MTSSSAIFCQTLAVISATATIHAASVMREDFGALGDRISSHSLSADGKSEPTDPAAWTKTAAPVLATSTADRVYAPGHNGFFKSADGKQDWIIFHANGGPDWKCTARRAPYIQRFRWSAAGVPQFGRDVRGDGLSQKGF